MPETENIPFKPGDVVFLKSGGHHMVVRFALDDTARCDWHDQNGIPHWADYNVAQLEPAAPPLPQNQESAAPGFAPDDSDWRKSHGLR